MFFRILKQRFEIIHHGIRFRSATQMDCVGKACCTFHNQLLENDKEFEDYHDVGAHGGHENHVVDDDVSDLGDNDGNESDSHVVDDGDVTLGSKSFILPNLQIEAINYKKLADELAAHFSFV